MHIRFLILLLLISANVSAQGVKTDTVKRGYYIPLDSNMMSCKIGITPHGKKLQLTNNTGNRIPDSTIHTISYLEPGSVVVYSEITVLKNGILEKAPSVRYVVGSKNTAVVKRDPYYPDTLSAKEIAAIVFDPHVYSFSVSWLSGGAMYMFDITGNGVSGNAKTSIEQLPSGTKIWFEAIKRKEDNGTIRHQSNEIYIVR